MPRFSTILLLAGALVLCGAPNVASAQSTRTRTARGELDAMLLEVESHIKRLREASKVGIVDELTRKLADLRGRMTGDYGASESDVPEVHAVGVYEGSAAPAGVLKGKDRFTKGYAEVHVTYTARPIVLVISAYEPVFWRVQLADGVKLQAVVLAGYHSQTVEGLPQGALILRRIVEEGSSERVQCFRWGDDSFDKASSQVRFMTGHDITTLTGAYRYDGQPLVVGPENKEWRSQHLLAEAQRLREQATADERQRKLDSVKQLRFRAIHYSGRPTDETGPGNDSAAIGDFTTHGPISSSLTPIARGMRQFVDVPREELQFALNHHSEFGILGDGDRDFTKVPLAADMPRTRFNAAAYDSKRHRILLAARDDRPRLLSYDLATASWEVAGDSKHFLASLTYVPERDCFYGITSAHRHPHEEGSTTTFLIIGPQGKVQQETALSQPIKTHWWDWGGVHLVAVDDRVVVLTPPRRNRFQQYISHLHVIDPDNGEVIFSGEQHPHDGQAAPKKVKPPVAGGLLHQLWTKFDESEELIATLGQQGKKKLAAELAASLRKIRDELKGNAIASDQPELHLVGIHVANGTVVRVTDTTRPVVLALCSYNESQWTVEVGTGVTLKRVIVGGYHHQRVKGVPSGVPLDIHTYDDRTGGFHTYKRDDPRFTEVSRTLRKETGLDITTFQGNYEYGGKPVVLGPENSEWRIQRAIVSLDKLLASRDGSQAGRGTAKLKKLRFSARYFKTHQMHRPHQVSSYAEFSILGPLIKSIKPLPAPAQQMLVNPKSGKFVLRNQGDIILFDPETSDSRKLEWDPALPRLSWPSAIAFDSRRNRLLLTSFGGGGYLYGYDFAKQEWSVVRKPGLGSSALVYAEPEDAIYGLNLNLGGEGLRTLSKFNAEGAILSQVNLSEPIVVPSDFGPPVQLRYAQGYVVILTAMPTSRPSGAPHPTENQEIMMKIHVVDPESGEIVYDGTLQPHAEHPDLGEAAPKKSRTSEWLPPTHGSNQLIVYLAICLATIAALSLGVAFLTIPRRRQREQRALDATNTLAQNAAQK